MSYWPWWAGSLALGAIAVGYAKASGRTLGVSGTLRRAARPFEELAAERIERSVASDAAAFEAALRAATEAEFGPTNESTREKTMPPPAAVANDDAEPEPLPTPWLGQIAFIVMIAIGAFIATWLRGGLSAQITPGPTYEHLVAGGWKLVPVLVFGGALVGFGTRMSGGCTSGHGLSGCGRLVPSSLAATAAFFGMGVVTSFVLAWWAR